MKKICTSICLLLTLFSCLFLSACVPISTDDAEVLINDFCSALSKDDYEAAASYLHPICELDAQGLQKTIENMEKTLSCDFKDGVEFGQRTYIYMSSNFNTNGIKGAYSALTMHYNITIGEKEFMLETTVIGDNAGISISQFKINLNQSVTNNTV